jgi:hypothetical protein
MAIEMEGTPVGEALNGTSVQAAPVSKSDPYNDPTFKHGYFETDLPKHYLSGRIVARVREADGEVAARIIDANEPWAVDVYWELSGNLVPMICGKWCVRVFLESLGADSLDKELNHRLIELHPCQGGKYEAHFYVPKNFLRVEECGTPFEAVVGLTYLTNCRIRPELDEQNHMSYRPGAIAAFVKLPTMQFFNEGIDI